MVGCMHEPGQVSVRIQTILHCCLDQAEHHRTAGSSLWCIGEQEVLPVNNEGLDASLCSVVAQLQSAVLLVIGQVWPLLLEIVQCLTQSRLRRGSSGICPRKHPVCNRFCLLQPLFIALFCCFVRNLLFHSEKKIAVGQSLRCGTALCFSLGQRPHSLVEFSSGVRPAAYRRDFFRQIMISGITICVQVSFESFQKGFRMLCPTSRLVFVQDNGLVGIPAGTVQPHIAFTLRRLPRF